MRCDAQPGTGRMFADCAGFCAPPWQEPRQLCGFMRSRSSGLSTTRARILSSVRLVANRRRWFEVGLRDLLLDLVPVRGAFLEIVRLKSDDLDRVPARRRPAGIRERRTDRKQHRFLDVHRAARIVVTHAQGPRGLDMDPDRHRLAHAAIDREPHRLGGRIVGDEQRRPGLPGVDTSDEIVAPRLRAAPCRRGA